MIAFNYSGWECAEQLGGVVGQFIRRYRSCVLISIVQVNYLIGCALMSIVHVLVPDRLGVVPDRS